MPAITSVASGASAICWEDHRYRFSQTYCQLLDRELRPVGPNLRVGADTLVQTNPDVTGFGSRFTAVWEVAASQAGRTVYGARIDSAGNIGPRLRVADNPPNEDCRSPSVAAWRNGFVAAWTQGLTDSRVRMRWFGAEGVPHGPSAGLAFENAARPRVACDSGGNGIVVWEEATGTPSRIWGQAFDSTGNMTTAIFPVNDSGPVFRYHPAIACDPGGNSFVVAWEDGRAADSVRIFGQHLNRWGNAAGRNFRLDSSAGINAQGSPNTAVAPSGYNASVWVDNRGDMINVLDAYRGPATRFFTANRDRATAAQSNPVAVRDGRGTTTVFWLDQRRNYYGSVVYGRRFDRNLNPLGSSFPAGDALPGRSAQLGSAAANSNGRVVVTWSDNRTGSNDIYAQVYDMAGIPVGSNFRVNDDAGSANQSQPFVAENDSGNFVIVWSDERKGHWAPYAQWFDRLGQRTGVNWAIDTVGLPGGVWLSERGDFWVSWAWRDTIRARHFAHDSVPFDTSIAVSDSTGRQPAQPVLTGTALGTVWVAWTDSLAAGRQVYGRRIASSGQPLSGVFRAVESSSPWPQTQCGISSDGRTASPRTNKPSVSNRRPIAIAPNLCTPRNSCWMVKISAPCMPATA